MRDDRIAASVFAGTGPGQLHPGLFTIQATPLAPHAPEEVEAAIYDELDRLRRVPPTEEELRRVRTSLLAANVRRLASSQGLAFQLASSQATWGDWRETFRLQERMREVGQGGDCPGDRRVFPAGGKDRRHPAPGTGTVGLALCRYCPCSFLLPSSDPETDPRSMPAVGSAPRPRVSSRKPARIPSTRQLEREARSQAELRSRHLSSARSNSIRPRPRHTRSRVLTVLPPQRPAPASHRRAGSTHRRPWELPPGEVRSRLRLPIRPPHGGHADAHPRCRRPHPRRTRTPALGERGRGRDVAPAELP